jgi:hypothetical protein
VPFAEHRGAITGLAQHLGDRDLPRMQPARRTGGDRLADAGADRQAPGHQRGSARRALVFDVEVRELQPLAGEPVDARRRRVENAAVVAGRHAISDVVGEHEQDVRLADCCARAACVVVAVFKADTAASAVPPSRMLRRSGK